ncbi:hypothetical protein [Caballeronia sp. TF1N1]|uniref:hypothetical protein n=1 Tax=Caballeronia sp. TF1N1 TaxID=2878153 RepID=UPI001FD607F2|nr:hypothetical protein [Caballeronia sp. TF1N1]
MQLADVLRYLRRIPIVGILSEASYTTVRKTMSKRAEQGFDRIGFQTPIGPKNANGLLRDRELVLEILCIHKIHRRRPAQRPSLTREPLCKFFRIKWSVLVMPIAHHGYDRIYGPSATEPTDLVEPVGIDKINCLRRINQNRTTGDLIAVLGKPWRKAFDDRLVATHKNPAIAVPPAPAMAVAKR